MRFSKALFAISAVAVAALTVMLLSNIARADVESPAPYQYYRTTQSFKISMISCLNCTKATKMLRII